MCQRKAQKIGPINALDNCHKRNWSLTNSQSLRCHFRFCAATRNSFHWIFFLSLSLCFFNWLFSTYALLMATHIIIRVYHVAIERNQWANNINQKNKKNAPIEIEKCREKKSIHITGTDQFSSGKEWKQLTDTRKMVHMTLGKSEMGERQWMNRKLRFTTLEPKCHIYTLRHYRVSNRIWNAQSIKTSEYFFSSRLTEWVS